MSDPPPATDGPPQQTRPGGAQIVEVSVARFVAGRWFLPAVGVSLLLLVAAATLPPPSSRFTLTVQTRSFTVGADASGAALQSRGADGDPGVPIAANSLAVLAGILTKLPEAMTPKGPPDHDPAGVVSVVGAQGRLMEVRLSPGSRLTVELVSGETLAYSGTAGIALGLTLHGQVTAAPSPAEAPVALGPPPEPIEVAAGPSHPLRAILKLPVTPTEPTETGIEDLPIRFLGFSRPRLTSDGRAPFRSDILSGTLRLSDVGRDVTLRPGDPILLGCWGPPALLHWAGVASLYRWWRGGECFAGHLARARLDAGTLRVEVVGNAERIAVGPRDAMTEATPSLLAYLLGQESAKLLWGAAIALLGLLWKVHGWARGVLTP
jgi:hypothetical protein